MLNCYIKSWYLCRTSWCLLMVDSFPYWKSFSWCLLIIFVVCWLNSYGSKKGLHDFSIHAKRREQVGGFPKLAVS